MSGFSPAQLRKLTGKLDRCHVQSRNVDGKSIDYIEGWFALAEANAIFGFANWDRETVHFERLFERTRGETTTCSYLARVRITVRTGGGVVSREGTGCGTASASSAGEAHERAIKAAETDATKRALATFGNRFGLCLYDKEQNGVTEKAKVEFAIIKPDGEPLASNLSPEGFCSGLRQILEATSGHDELVQWQQRNAPNIARLRTLAPTLTTPRGEHYADVLERLFAVKLNTSRPVPAKQQECTATASSQAVESLPASNASANGQSEPFPLAPSRIALGPRIDKASLAIKTTRRLRDKNHLRHVGTLPCLICKATPSHPHHLTFSQPRGLSLKVSDEFVVPLCAVHHNDVHRGGNEPLWWNLNNVEPLAIAQVLWEGRATNAGSFSRSEELRTNP